MKRALAPQDFAVRWDAACGLVRPATRLRIVGFCVDEGLLLRDRAYELDRAVYRRVGGEDAAYSAQMRALIYNMLLHPALRAADVPRLAAMTDADMREGTVLESIERDEQRMRAQFEGMLRETYDSLSGDAPVTMACRKCRGSNLEFEQKQTRSADEAMTVFCTCRDCGQKWKM